MKFLHTMIRVKNLERSLDFYQNYLNMKILKKIDFEEQKFTLVYLGYQDLKKEGYIELTYNWDNRNYEIGNAFGHLAIGVEDIYQCCEKLKSKGAQITREPGPLKGSEFVIAFLKDPDGYSIELVQM